MKNNKIPYIVIFIICITVLGYTFLVSYNKWYDTSREYEKISEEEIESTIENERISFIYEYFPILLEPFDYDILYENIANQNTTKEELEKFLNTNLFSKITVSEIIVDYVLVDSEEFEDYNKYNYIAYFYDREYYLDNEQKDTNQAKVSMNINLIEYYPGNCKIEIPMN